MIINGLVLFNYRHGTFGGWMAVDLTVMQLLQEMYMHALVGLQCWQSGCSGAVICSTRNHGIHCIHSEAERHASHSGESESIAADLPSCHVTWYQHGCCC